MLQVLLLILKIIGIMLAVLVGTVLLLLCLVLFVPVRYRIYAKKREEILLQAKFSWLLHLLTVPVGFQNGELSAKMKIFGITVKDLLAEEMPKEPKKPKAPKPAKKPKPEKKAEQAKPESILEEKPKTEAKLDSVPERVFEPGFTEEPKQKNQKSLRDKISGFLEKIRNLKYTIQRFYAKIKQALKKAQETKAFILEEKTKAALKLVFGQVWYLIRKLLPGKVKGEVRFGTEDPALTGEILGGVCIFYPLFMDNVNVIPDFEKPCLEGELTARGSIPLVILVRIAWKIFRDPNIRHVYGKFKEL